VNNAVIAGSRGTDDAGPTILLNGVEIPSSPSRGFGERSWFAINSASAKAAGTEILPGNNTLAFVVENGGADINPTGFRVDDLFARAAPAGSVPIPGLYNTGVGDNQLPLDDLETEQHYKLASAPDDTIEEIVTVLDDDFPIPPWADNTSSSRWIGPVVGGDTDANGPPGDYEFTLDFDMTGLDTSSAVIMGLWSVDNTGADILLNGVATGNTQSGSFPVLSPFEISTALGDTFLPGVNTLTFLVNNAGDANNPIGFRVESILGFTGGGVRGDFNRNGVLDAPDIDDLTARSAALNNPPEYDLNGDSLVDVADVNVWVKDLFKSWIGDANLDHEFNSSDLVDVLASGKYEANEDSVWTQGDFNGDGRTNSSDLVVALADGGYEQGRPPAVAAVPEPASWTLLLLGGLLMLRRRR
jgi:hypothetical protein